MRQLKVDKLLGPDACRERHLVLAMVAARIVDPRSKLSTATCLNATALPELLDAREAIEDELYAAIDWLLERQDSIEKKLGKRHLREGAMALYDLTSSYFEGTHCPLAARGYTRDGKKRKLWAAYRPARVPSRRTYRAVRGHEQHPSRHRSRRWQCLAQSRTTQAQRRRPLSRQRTARRRKLS